MLGPTTKRKRKISPKKTAVFCTFSEREGGGPTRIQKLQGIFLGFLLDIIKKKGDFILLQKFGGNFEVVLRYMLGCFEVVFGGMCFPQSA